MHSLYSLVEAVIIVIVYHGDIMVLLASLNLISGQLSYDKKCICSSNGATAIPHTNFNLAVNFSGKLSCDKNSFDSVTCIVLHNYNSNKEGESVVGRVGSRASWYEARIFFIFGMRRVS